MKKSSWVLFVFILLKFALQFTLISPEYDLQRDEYLYLDQAHHLAWGYLSVPPVISWISVIIYFLGNTIFWIKFFPALFGALTIVVVWKTIEELEGNLFALILGATSILFSIILRLNVLYQPNSLDVLCWSSLFFIIIKYFKTENVKFLYVAAIIFAFGFLNKYNIVFLILGLFPAILFTDHWRIFLRKELYFSLLLAFSLISPNLLWQYNNGFPVIYHLNELAETQLIYVDRLDFLFSQLQFFLGSIFVIVSGILSLWLYKPFKKYRPFFWTFFFTLAIFMYFRAKDYYAIGLYPIYISFGAVFLADLLKNGWKKHLKPFLIILPLIVFIPASIIGFPNKNPDYIVKHSNIYKKTGMLRWEDGQNHAIPQDYADMLGWKELASKVDSVYIHMPNRAATLVLCDNYGQAGAINYYTKENIKAVSFHADYINWFDLNQKYVNVIMVKEYSDDNTEFKEITPYFNTAVVADSITNSYSREYKTMIFAFTGTKANINERIKNEIMKIKNTVQNPVLK